MAGFAIRVTRKGWRKPRYVTNANAISTDPCLMWRIAERYVADAVAARKREKFAGTKQADMVFDVVEVR